MKVRIHLPVIFLLLAVITNAQVRPLHTVILILENHSFSQIAGNAQAPYINAVLNDSHTASLTQSFALTHPSQPNYIMFYSGSSQGITDNNVPGGLPFTTPNLGASLIQAGFSFIGYSEDLPSVGYTGASSGLYVRKHNPWVNWQDAVTNGIPSASNRPFSDFPGDFSQLPTVSIVVPNLEHDIHDGTIATGDSWVQSNLGSYIEWCKTNNGLFILTFDEDDNSSNNQILTFFTGANIKAGSYNQRITHYNLLRTIEELYTLPYIGFSADSSAIKNIWLTPLPVQFIDFKVIASGRASFLTWQTAEEQNTKEFIVERSIDQGREWKAIAALKAAGNSSIVRKYNYSDTNTVSGLNLYRIKQIDQDGHFVYSKVFPISIQPSTSFYKIYPNPVDGRVFIASTKNEKEEVIVSLWDISGRLKLQKKLFIIRGTPSGFDVSNLIAGNYFIEINNGTERKIESIIVK
jgi:phosphatidylinositol-3-phosphatase